MEQGSPIFLGCGHLEEHSNLKLDIMQESHENILLK
jgi:hypothetical protein